MRPLSSLAALVALARFSSADPNGWSKTTTASDSPTKLDDCGCWPIYQTLLRCQHLQGANDETRDCVCIDNPDGWYPSMDGCRNCLSPGSLEDDDFFDNMSRLITQLFVSCTNAGGGVNGDGVSICASNYYREACVSLGTGGQPSWASFEVFESDTKGNASYVLDIEEYDEDASNSATGTAIETTASTTASSSEISSTAMTITTSTEGLSTETSSTVMATTTTAGELSTAGSGTSDNASGTETGSASATTAPSSAANLAGDGTVAGLIRGAIIAAVVGAVLF